MEILMRQRKKLFGGIDFQAASLRLTLFGFSLKTTAQPLGV
jgi:hypothetical protein